MRRWSFCPISILGPSRPFCGCRGLWGRVSEWDTRVEGLDDDDDGAYWCLWRRKDMYVVFAL